MSATSTTAAGVRFDQVSKTFRLADGDLHVLDRVSFTADPGDFVAILGPSGSGKSTSLGVIAGLVKPDDGSFDAPDRSHVGYVFQNPRLLPWRTVEENLLIGRAARRQAGAPAFTHDVDYYLDLVGLLNYKRYFPAALSGGMQQRTSIARALAVQPSLLLMDEPFSSLDELTAREQRSYLLRIWERERTTVLFVTHNVLEAITLATSIVVVSERPAHVIEQIPVDLPRPRRLNSEVALSLQLKILNMLGVDDPNALS